MRAHSMGPILDALEADKPQFQAEAGQIATVALNEVGSTLGSIFTSTVATKLGSEGGMAATTAASLFSEFEQWVIGKISGPTTAEPK